MAQLFIFSDSFSNGISAEELSQKKKMRVNIKDSEIKMASDFQQQFWKLEDEIMFESSKEK